jgi:hypothetical protein
MGTSTAQNSESYNLSADCALQVGNLGLNVALNGGFCCKIPLFGRMLSALFSEIGRR